MRLGVAQSICHELEGHQNGIKCSNSCTYPAVLHFMEMALAGVKLRIGVGVDQWGEA